MFSGLSDCDSLEQGAIAVPDYNQTRERNDGMEPDNWHLPENTYPTGFIGLDRSLKSMSVTRYPTIDEESDPDC
jgi:hypothetical protein